MQIGRATLLALTSYFLLGTILYYIVYCPEVTEDRTYVPLNETSQLHLSPIPLDRRLVDLDDFTFLTDHDCNNTTPFILGLVHSAPRNVFNRLAIRKTWGKDLKVLFLIGETDLDLDEEERRYGDLIRGSFLDSYKNLTYKHVMGLKWVSSKCPGAKYVLKTDDDVFVHVEALKDWLQSMSPHGAMKLLACNVERNAVAWRTFRSKWRVTPEEYPNRYYPDYCIGWVILYTPDVALALYEESTKTPYFWIDDVHVTGILAERAKLTHTHLGKLAITDNSRTPDVKSVRRIGPFIFLLTSPEMFTTLARLVKINRPRFSPIWTTDRTGSV